MRCSHCEEKRALTSAWLAEHGYANWIEWARSDALQVAKEPPPWRTTDDGTLATCPCPCHAFARIAGRLPRLRS
jgi:hypothetical protein